MPSLFDLTKQAVGDITEKSLETGTNPYLYRLRENSKLTDGDTIDNSRLLGYDTFESTIGTKNNEKANKLTEAGVTPEQQKNLGLAGKSVLKDWVQQNPNAIFARKGMDAFGRELLDNPDLAEHMIKSGTAVPTDRYNTKLQTLYRNSQEKIQKLDPSRGKAMEIQREYNIDRQDPGFLSSVLQAPKVLGAATTRLTGEVGDFVADVVTPGDSHLFDSIKDREKTNEFFGVDDRETNFRQAEAAHQFRQGNYGKALAQGGAVLPEMLAESAPTIASYFIPVAGEAKFAVTADKFYSMFKGAKEGKDALTLAKSSRILTDAEKAIESSSKVRKLSKAEEFVRGNTGGFMLNVGAQTNQDIEERTKNNNGVEPSADEIALMTANNILQMGTDKFIDFNILKGTSLSGKVVDTFKNAAKVIPEEGWKNIGVNLLKNGTKIAGAMGEEGAQEYYQQWAQILNQKLGTTKYGNLENLLDNKEVQDEAISAGIMGAAMGGSIQGIHTSIDQAKSILGAPKSKVSIDTSLDSSIPLNKEEKEKVTKQPTPDEMLRTLDEVEAELKTTGEYELGKAELEQNRKEWTDIKNAVDNEDVYKELKDIFNTTKDMEQKNYLGKILKKADSYLGKSKTLFDAVEGTPNEGVYTAADNIVRGMGSEWDAKLYKPLDIADAIQSVQTLREMRNEYGVNVKNTDKEDALYDKAVNAVKTVLTQQLGKYPNFEQLSSEQKVGIIGDELYNWLKQSASDEDINDYMASMIHPVVEAMAESKAFGSAPKGSGLTLDMSKFEKPSGKEQPVGGLKLNLEGMSKPQAEAKTDWKEQQSKTKEKVKAKLFADESMNVEDITTDTHTGISKGTINKLAETFKVPAGKVKSSLDIAFQRMQIKKMGDISKESNEAQYNVYYGEDGVLPNFIKYKYAAEKGDIDTATKAMDNLVKRYSDQMYKLMIAMDSINPVQSKIRALGKDVTLEELQKEIGDVRITIQGAKGSKSEYTIDGMSIAKMTDSVPQNVRDQIKMGKGGHVLEAIHESVVHLQNMFDREGLADALPEVRFNKVLREDIYNNLVDKIAGLMDKRDKLAKVDLDPSVKRTSEELDAMANAAKELADVEKELTKRIKEQQEVFQARSGNLYQYNNTTFRDQDKSIDVSKKMGQETGTITKVEADRLGLDLEEGVIKDYVPMKSADEYKKILDKINALKEERAAETANRNELASGVIEQHKNRKMLLDKIKIVEEQLGYKVLTTARKAAENADKLVVDLTVRLMKEKAREKELKSALAFLEKNEDVFKNATVNAEQLVKLQDSYGKWMNDVVSKKGKMPTAKERNDKLREMVQGTTLLETIVNDLNKVAKIGVVLARKLMGMYTYDKPLMEAMKTELANVASKVEKTQEELAKAKVDMKEQVRQSRIQIVQAFRENGMTPDMSAKTIENVLMKSTRLKVLERKINSAKKMSETRLNEINAEIKELENELKGTRLFKQNIENNLNVVDALRKAGIEIKAPLDMDTLKTRGSMLGNMNFNDVMSMVPGDKDIENLLKVTEGQVSKGMERLYTGTVGVQKLGQLLAANPALMLIARVSKVDGKEAYELNYDKDMLNALMLTMNNYIAINGSDLDINTKLDVSKIIGVGEYDPKVNQVYHRMMGMGKLHTTIASRIGDDFARAIGISQGDMGTEQYRKLIADLGNTALIMAKENKLVEEPRMTADQWNEVAGKSSQIPEGSGAEVKFVKLRKTDNTSVKVRANTAIVFKRLNGTLNSLNEQNTYRTHKIFAVKNGKKYEIDKSPFGIPEKTQEVMRHLEDQTYVLQEKALAKMLATYRSNPELVLKKAGWVDLDSMKNSLQDDKDAQESVNREIEDTLAKLDEMEAAYTRGEITEDVYFNWFFTVNGRFMVDSVGINPQADKHFSRFLLVPEQSSNREWDLSNEIDKLLMNDGIAQAFGYDIDKSSEEATEKFAKDIISRFKNDEKFEDKVMNGEIEVPHFGHALQAIEFMRVMKKGGKFRATLTAEYDAKTSGPMHKLMQAPILDDGEFGSITKEWLNKGAILINQGFSESSAEHVSGVEDGYQTIAKEANRALTEQSPVLIRNDKITTDYRSLFKDINGLLDKLVSDNKVTKQGRELSKYAFIPFGYASSTETIKQYVGEQLAYDILKKIVNPKFSNHSDIMRALNMNAKDYARLQENLRTKPANEVYINKPQGVITYKKDILGMLSEMFTMTYGEAYKSAMNSIFQPHVAMNDTIKDVTSAMFRMWKIKYDSMMVKEPNATVERKMEVIRDMEDFFPLIKAPWSYSKQDGIAIFDTKRASMKNEELPPVNTTTNRNGKLSSETVQAMITEMEETFAAGAVLPIHWIDGTQIASVLMRGGITGVHDAIVIGMKGSYTQQTVKDMNKAMYDVNRNYNMFDEFQLALLNMLDKIDNETLSKFIRQESKKEDKGIDLGSLKARVDNIADNIRKARTKLYSNEVTVGNIIAFRDTEFKSGKDESTVNPRETSIKELLKKLDAKMQGIETTINEVSSKNTAEEGIENLTQKQLMEKIDKIAQSVEKIVKSTEKSEDRKAEAASKTMLKTIKDKIVFSSNKTREVITSVDNLIQFANEYNSLMIGEGKVATITDIEQVNSIFTTLSEMGIPFKPLTINITPSTATKGGERGRYDVKGNVIHMYYNEVHKDANPAQVVLHEYVHAITMNNLDRNPEVKAKVTALMEHVRNERPDLKVYGMTNEAEFLAEAIAEPRFQKVLAEIPSYKGTGVLDYVKNLFKELLNSLTKKELREANALTDALELVVETANIDEAPFDMVTPTKGKAKLSDVIIDATICK